MNVRVHRLGVYQIHFGGTGHVVQQSRSGINVQAGADDDEYVRLLHIPDGSFNLRHRLAKPHDERAELRTVARLVAQLYFIFLRCQFLDEMRIIRVAAGTNLRQFPMQVYHACVLPARSCRLSTFWVTTVTLKSLSRSATPDMPGIRHYIQQLLATFVIEINDQFRITVHTPRESPPVPPDICPTVRPHHEMC